MTIPPNDSGPMARTYPASQAGRILDNIFPDMS
jgi:hypothetical protein